MKDIYEEQLVKRMAEKKYAYYMGACVFVTAVVALLSLVIHPVLLVAAILLGIGDYYLFRRFDVEFEYLYINGELEVDKIYAKSSRKSMLTVDMKDLEMMGEKDSHHLDRLRTMKYKSYDFTANNPEHKVYEMYIRRENELLQIYFEPNEKIVEAIRQISPRKVFVA